jgi:hypothetical protein
MMSWVATDRRIGLQKRNSLEFRALFCPVLRRLRRQYQEGFRKGRSPSTHVQVQPVEFRQSNSDHGGRTKGIILA